MPLAVISTREEIWPLLSQVVELADRHKELLGFLSQTAFSQACIKERMIVAVEAIANSQTVVGFVLYGGVFPQARVYQIAVDAAHRRDGVASGLMRALTHHLEAQGYLSLSAKVANDLPQALAFYEACGFRETRRLAGGNSRGRELIVVARSLEGIDLFSGDARSGQTERFGLAMRSGRSGDVPFYVFDLNVLFDLLRNRSRTASARKLFGAALAHKVRIVASPEFIVELRRTSLDTVDDVVLQMALQLPQLVPAAPTALEAITGRVHQVVFEDTKSPHAGSAQSRSDARHVAHAALARASAFITSDVAILSQSRLLREAVGIDVVSLEDFVEILSDDLAAPSNIHTRGQDFEFSTLSQEDAVAYFSSNAWLEKVLPLLHRSAVQHPPVTTAVRQRGVIIAACVIVPNHSPAKHVQLVLHPNPRWLDGEYFLDALFDRAVTQHAGGPIAIDLFRVEDQSHGVVTAFARSRGFVFGDGSTPPWKVALCAPITPKTWAAFSSVVRLRTGLGLGDLPQDETELEVEVSGVRAAVPLAELEEMLSPTILAWHGRAAVVQPIAASYASELLGTGDQHRLFESPRASFLSRRSYVSSPRSSKLMVPGSMIFFYESQRTKGRGAIVALARIVDATTVPKGSVSRSQLEHVVVEDVANFSRGEEVLLTSFDNLLILPRAYSLRDLRRLGATGTQNYQSTTSISHEAATAIIEYGWSADA